MSTSLQAGVVAASIAGIVLVNLAMADRPIDTSPITQQQSREGLFGEVETAVNADQAAELSDRSFVEWFSRPLFAKNRRPWEAPQLLQTPPKLVAQPEKPVARQIDPPDFKLVGISISDGAAKALLRRDSGFEPVWVSEGDAVGDWMVSVIDSQSVTVRQDDQTVSVNLYPDVSAKQ